MSALTIQLKLINHWWLLEEPPNGNEKKALSHVEQIYRFNWLHRRECDKSDVQSCERKLTSWYEIKYIEKIKRVRNLVEEKLERSMTLLDGGRREWEIQSKSRWGDDERQAKSAVDRLWSSLYVFILSPTWNRSLASISFHIHTLPYLIAHTIFHRIIFFAFVVHSARYFSI